MSRLLATFVLIGSLAAAVAADPPSDRSLALQKAMVTARQFLDVNMPAEAITTLEAEVANADGDKAFLSLLREAYLAELQRLEKVPMPDPARVAEVRRSLALLGGMVPAPKTEPAVTDLDTAREAAAAFNKGNYTDAARLFAALPNLTTDQKTAWAYCRIKLAAERVNTPGCDAVAIAAEVTDALKLVPDHAELQKVGRQIIAAASKVNGRREPAVASGGDAVETASFRVRHTGNRDLAEAVAKAAEAQRNVIFERWSGPPAGAWGLKCEIILHPTGEAFARATGRPPQWTGNAVVRLTDGRAEERRIDLRADDPGLIANALPRELTHVVLADLFPDKPAPKWAVEGMAVLAGSPEEISRYTRTLVRCAREGEWFALAQLLELKDFPPDKVTGFYCQSVSLTEYLIRLAGGERNFTIFLRDCHRYGTSQAIKRQFGLDGPQALEAAWKRAALETIR